MDQTDLSRRIVPVPSDRSDLLIFEIRNRISEADMTWMAGEVDQAIERHNRIDLMLIMTNFEGADIGAVFNGDAASVSLRSLRHLRKYAVIGAPVWARTMIESLKWLTPVEERTFALHEAEAAWTWINEGRPSRFA
jgi:hypothetical protein